MVRGQKVNKKDGGTELKNKINFRTLSIIIRKIGGRIVFFPKVFRNAIIRGRMREVSGEASFIKKKNRGREKETMERDGDEG